MELSPLYPIKVVALVVIIACVSVTLGGLPGTKDSPSATVKGEAITGRSAAN